MNFLSTEYFITTAREGSFTKAAEQLFITQQTLSAHVSSLEDEVGAKLFERTRPLKLTYAGDVFMKYAEAIYDLHESMLTEFQDITTAKRGRLRIGVGHTRGRVLMPDIIAEFSQKYPRVEIIISEGLNEELPKLLLTGEIDMALAVVPEGTPAIETDHFYNEDVILVVSKKLLNTMYPEGIDAVISQIKEDGNINKLKELPWLLSSEEDLTGIVGKHQISESGFVPHIAVTSTNIETLLSLCVEGLGGCFSTKLYCDRTLTQEQMDELIQIPLAGHTRFEITFARRVNQYMSSTFTDFCSIAKGVGSRSRLEE